MNPNLDSFPDHVLLDYAAARRPDIPSQIVLSLFLAQHATDPDHERPPTPIQRMRVEILVDVELAAKIGSSLATLADL